MNYIKFILTAFFAALLFCLFGFRNINKLNYSETIKPKSFSTITESEPCTNISLKYMDIFYIGMDNPMSVSAEGIASDNLIVTTNEGFTLKNLGNGNYTVNPDGNVRQAVITINTKDNKGKVSPIKQFNYRVRKLGHPTVLYGYTVGGTRSSKDLLSIDRINCGQSEGCPIDGLSYKIEDYTFHFFPKKGNPFKEVVTGSGITNSMRDKVAESKSGDIIVISDVNVQGPDRHYTINGPIITIE